MIRSIRKIVAIIITIKWSNCSLGKFETQQVYFSMDHWLKKNKGGYRHIIDSDYGKKYRYTLTVESLSKDHPNQFKVADILSVLKDHKTLWSDYLKFFQNTGSFEYYRDLSDVN